jgi:hypothetical protein
MEPNTEVHPADQLTCGKGLAASADLPAGLAALMMTMADVLDEHTRALDPSDASAARELHAYRAIIVAQRNAAAQLDSAAGLMRAERDLPPALHDRAVMRGRAAADALDRYRAAAAGMRRLLARVDR